MKKPISLWLSWWSAVQTLRPAFSRNRTFYWFVMVLAGYVLRQDMAGVSSIMRSLPLSEACYDRLLDFFHTTACDLQALTCRWGNGLCAHLPGLIRVNQKLVVVVDGVKVGKEGKKMPARKMLHQESESNTKADFIMGHSCQAVTLLAGGPDHPLAVPLTARIHEGIVASNRDKRTLMDKLLACLLGLKFLGQCYVVADAFYACGKLAHELKRQGHHLVTRVKKNAVAFRSPIQPKRKKQRGQPKKFGAKVYLRDLFSAPKLFIEAQSPVYHEKGKFLRYHSEDLLWRTAGCLVRFVWVIHPDRGRVILMSTDLNLSPLEIIQLYGWRFKIEVAFKQTIHTIGTFAYPFWMKALQPIRRGDKAQYLHRRSKRYRFQIWRKLDAYHLHIQCGLIVHGLLQFLAMAQPQAVWACFNSWMRTKRLNVHPSEAVVRNTMLHSFPHFLAFCDSDAKLKLFLKTVFDKKRLKRFNFVA